MAKHLHHQYVDRRLSGARQLLQAASAANVNPVYKEACIDSALLQSYYAVFHYINHLLDTYQRPLNEDAGYSLNRLIAEESRYVSELLEWKELSEKSSSYLSIVINHSNTMLRSAYPKESEVSLVDTEVTSSGVMEEGGAKEGLHLIAASSESDAGLPLTVDNVQWVVDQCYQLIQRQREHLIEC